MKNKMKTIADYSAESGIPINTIYAWIYRNQAEKKGIKVHKFGKTYLVSEVKK